MGIGLSMGINDLVLLRKSLLNYLFAMVVGLATSAFYFLLSPINEAHSEILARISPNIYDVLIAFFGGLAGIIATSSKQKGNVIPGAAIATALMPPLCTAGYGLATLQFTFLFGALYLFLINTVFIAWATFLVVRLLNFPFKELPEPSEELQKNRMIWVVIMLTLLPSFYFGYDIVQRNKFSASANRFVAQEAVFPNDYLLHKEIDPKTKSISLTFGGRRIREAEVDTLRTKLDAYGLGGTQLEVTQGFAGLGELKNNEQFNQLLASLQAMEIQVKLLQARLDSLTRDTTATAQTDSSSINTKTISQ